MTNITQLRDFWEKEYESVSTPFDADEPDEWIVSLEQSGKIHGMVLDAGCGPGRTAFSLADRGYQVLGVDISLNAIERAKRKAAEKGNFAQFLQGDLCDLLGYEDRFDTVVDIGCFHSLYNDQDRAAYAASLHRVCRMGAVIYLRAFKEDDTKSGDFPHEHRPDLREDQIRAAFSANSWVVTDLEEREIALFISESLTIKQSVWFAEMRYA